MIHSSSKGIGAGIGGWKTGVRVTDAGRAGSTVSGEAGAAAGRGVAAMGGATLVTRAARRGTAAAATARFTARFAPRALRRAPRLAPRALRRTAAFFRRTPRLAPRTLRRTAAFFRRTARLAPRTLRRTWRFRPRTLRRICRFAPRTLRRTWRRARRAAVFLEGLFFAMALPPEAASIDHGSGGPGENSPTGQGPRVPLCSACPPPSTIRRALSTPRIPRGRHAQLISEVPL